MTPEETHAYVNALIDGMTLRQIRTRIAVPAYALSYISATLQMNGGILNPLMLIVSAANYELQIQQLIDPGQPAYLATADWCADPDNIELLLKGLQVGMRGYDPN